MAEILLENDSGILVVRLNRAEKKNALTVSMYDALRRALLEAKDDPNVHVVVMRGSDEVFSAGNDMLDFLSSPPVDSSAPAWQFIRALSTFPKPLLAAVSGVAIGIGTTMLLHCDLVYAAKGSRFSVPFVDLGVCAEGGSSFLLQKVMGYRLAAKALLLGDFLSAEEALTGGLLTGLVPDGDVFDYTMQQALALAAKPLSALVETKRLLRAADQAALEGQIEEEIGAFRSLLLQPSTREAFRAFSEGRNPDFRKIGD
jgi:enoyl-CoA hydratase/carnithine racemase